MTPTIDQLSDRLLNIISSHLDMLEAQDDDYSEAQIRSCAELLRIVVSAQKEQKTAQSAIKKVLAKASLAELKQAKSTLEKLDE